MAKSRVAHCHRFSFPHAAMPTLHRAKIGEIGAMVAGLRMLEHRICMDLDVIRTRGLTLVGKPFKITACSQSY